MSAHAIAAELRAKIRAERRRRRCSDQAAELEAHDSFCTQLEQGLNDLVRAIGTSDGLSLRLGERVFGRRVVSVVARDRVRPHRATRG
ncbi:hypothetical protein [Methylobacterium organophilum]|uniref:Uncharacterized protein n=1 Tax=Methylobacterium organophilum TaxID=410 RepID=A0ABQ4T6R2_METOR|nr:hypothetical protein [Methylobacterium organophilum]GJE26239.1 hypothetical protein LKMONMHP_1088 [Methylobacterium organophilum]